MSCANVNKLLCVLCLTSIIRVQTAASYEDEIDKLLSQNTAESKDLIEDNVKKKHNDNLQDTPTFLQENKDSTNISHIKNVDTVPLLSNLNFTKYVRSFQKKLKEQDSKKDGGEDDTKLAQISKWTRRLWTADNNTGNLMQNKTSEELLAWIKINKMNQSKNQGTWAAMCLCLLMFLIFGAVCYSGMWKKRNIQLSDYYWNDGTGEFHNRNGTVRPKFTIQDLLRAKAKYLPRFQRKKKTKKKYTNGIPGKKQPAEEEMKMLLEGDSTDEDLGYFRD